MLVADEEASSYNLLLEADRAMPSSIHDVAADIDRRLGELNVEYQSKRASGRLAPLTISLLTEGAGEAYKAACVRAGQREGQFKPAVLQYRKDLRVVVRPVCHRVISRSIGSSSGSLAFRFKTAFRHAAAERTATETVWIDAVASDGTVGSGESCPRLYVTGETIATARAFVSRHEASLRSGHYRR